MFVKPEPKKEANKPAVTPIKPLTIPLLGEPIKRYTKGGIRLTRPPAKQYFGFRYYASFAAATIYYFDLNGIASDLAESMAYGAIYAGRFTRMKLTLNFNGLNGDVVFTLRKNLADTPIKITVPASTIGIFNVAAGVQVATDDMVCIKYDPSAAATGSGKGSWALEFMPTS